jgi:MYXO-CTERM domain-containing protein
MSLLTVPAFADIPPEDACMAAGEGKACDNAGENGDQAGVCQKDTCTRATPDGPMSYECHVCKAGEGGAGGSSGDPLPEGGNRNEGGSKAQGGTKTEGGSKSTAGTTSEDDVEDDGDVGGCSVSAVPVGGLAGLLATLLGFGLAAARRRRAAR